MLALFVSLATTLPVLVLVLLRRRCVSIFKTCPSQPYQHQQRPSPTLSLFQATLHTLARHTQDLGHVVPDGSLTAVDLYLARLLDAAEVDRAHTAAHARRRTVAAAAAAGLSPRADAALAGHPTPRAHQDVGATIAACDLHRGVVATLAAGHIVLTAIRARGLRLAEAPTPEARHQLRLKEEIALRSAVDRERGRGTIAALSRVRAQAPSTRGHQAVARAVVDPLLVDSRPVVVRMRDRLAPILQRGDVGVRVCRDHPRLSSVDDGEAEEKAVGVEVELDMVDHILGWNMGMSFYIFVSTANPSKSCHKRGQTSYPSYNLIPSSICKCDSSFVCMAKKQAVKRPLLQCASSVAHSL